jgi:hypothetical protein
LNILKKIESNKKIDVIEGLSKRLEEPEASTHKNQYVQAVILRP